MYQSTVLETRKLNPAHNPIPIGVHIVKDREAIKILGAFVENKVDIAAS